MAKERDTNPNYPKLNDQKPIRKRKIKSMMILPSCFALGAKLRDVTVLR